VQVLGAKQRLLVVIPGNPGDAIFYADFARALEAHGHEVMVASQLLLTAAPSNLSSYAVHQVEAVTRYLAGTGRSVADVEIALLGHSVGAYLAYLVVAQRLLPVSRVFMLFPFLARPALSARLILKLVTSPRIFAAFLRCWRALPARLQDRLIAAAGAGIHGEWVRAALGSPQAFACAVMATAEAAEIASRADTSYLDGEPLFQDPERCLALVCAGDRWAPRAWRGGRGPATRRLDAISHAFVIDPAQCRVVAQVIHDRLGNP
jgi:pimeloyl-ACP methyl ester carboxylesterase